MMRNLRVLLFCAVAAFLIATPAAVAQSVADFYKGKQVILIVGASSGGGYDAQGRLLARTGSTMLRRRTGPYLALFNATCWWQRC